MSIKTVNILITALIVVVAGGYLFFISMPFLIIFASNLIYMFMILGIIILLIYGLYKLVSLINK